MVPSFIPTHSFSLLFRSNNMKNSLFSPNMWRRKLPKSSTGDQPKEPPTSERSETPTSPFIGRLKFGHEGRRERAASCSKQAPHRPPRPPSPNLFSPPIEATAKVPVLRAGSQRKPIQSQRSTSAADLLKAKRSMPELDGVWKGFLEDVNEDHDSLFNYPPQSPAPQTYSAPITSEFYGEAVSDSSSPFPLRRPCRGSPKPRAILHSSKSTTNIVRREETFYSSRSSMSSAESLSYVTDLDPLALFPAPPPLRIRKKIPKPLILLPTATIATLPPSPSTGSIDSTPVVTPTTPTLPNSPRRVTSPPSILKKSQSTALLYSTRATPDSLISRNYTSSPSMSLSRAPHVTQSMSNSSYTSRSSSHRSSSSDTTALSNSSHFTGRSRTNATSPGSRSEKPLPPLMLSGRQRNVKHPSPVEWGIAV
ncbi:hypothetical protein J3R30DRAFT_2927344 [Lentinula aciculospora]|uniref:Uncharacterized protein n=1 Tax=Lentinula aciculospora TaxID=153920 RepID=A0A9W9DDK6_9AGAR|nr:hypothetical protein J3R30DRAFT_2927344 [Lentinula aciculospora]